MQLDVAERTTPPELAPYIARYSGYSLRPLGSEPIRRREIPTGLVTVILTFEGKLTITDPGGSATFSSFVAGIDEHSVLTEYGELHGMQVDLPPLGAYRLFGLPMRELANTTIELDALDERPWSALITQLADRPSWERRFALLDETLLGWADEGPVPDPEVVWALRRLQRSGGLMRSARWPPRSGGAGGTSRPGSASRSGWGRRRRPVCFASATRYACSVPRPPSAMLRPRAGTPTTVT